MSKRSNNRFVTKIVDQNQQIKYKKCGHHVYSHNYVANMKKHDAIINAYANEIENVDLNSTINVKIAFHFLAPKNTFDKERVLQRACDIVLSINEDFNNYCSNPNTMNNFKYKSIVNQIFISNMLKQNIYLSPNYATHLPINPSNITFELGELYFYPIKNRLNLSCYDDVKEADVQIQVIKQYIHENMANAICPEYFLNIWIIDMTDTSILGFSSFPWENLDDGHGIVVNRRCFCPEDYGETNFCLYKTFTHMIGHYFGLLHVYSHNNNLDMQASMNLNFDTEPFETNCDVTDYPKYLNILSDPLDKINNKKLHTDTQYNPLFMNFMDYTHDKYVTMFTQNQIKKMRFSLMTYRPTLNSLIHKKDLPNPKYDPETDTLSNTNKKFRNTTLIPSYEPVNNPRLVSHNQSIIVDQDVYAEPYTNESVLKLIPNLSSNNIISANTNPQEQIINNIKNHIPSLTENTNTVLKNPKIVNNYYSDNGYATKYLNDRDKQYFSNISYPLNNKYANGPSTIPHYNGMYDAPQNNTHQNMSSQIPSKHVSGHIPNPYYYTNPVVHPYYNNPYYMYPHNLKRTDYSNNRVNQPNPGINAPQNVVHVSNKSDPEITNLITKVSNVNQELGNIKNDMIINENSKNELNIKTNDRIKNQKLPKKFVRTRPLSVL